MTPNKQLLNITQYLPHREPMLLVDYITDISSQHVVTNYLIPQESLFLANQIFQESGIVENMAQTCSAIVGQSYFNPNAPVPKEQSNVIGFISGIKKVVFFVLPQVGDQIRTKAELVSRFEGDDYSLCTMNVESFSKQTLLASATINLFLQKKE